MNKYFNWPQSLRRFVRFDAARSEDVNAALDEISGAMDAVEVDTRRAIKLPATAQDQLLEMSAEQRANLLLGFDPEGRVVAVPGGGRYTGDWATGTDYLVSETFRDPVSKNIYSTVQAHTSSTIAADLAAGKVRVSINLQELEAARDISVAAKNATVQAAAEAELDRSAAAASAAAASASELLATASSLSASRLNLGAKSTAPALDNQGQPLTTGATHYNTTLSKWLVWSGSAWVEGVSAQAGVLSVNGASGAVTLKKIGGQALTGTGDVSFKTLDGQSLAGTGNLSVVRVGDTLTTAVALDSPAWLPCNGAVYLQSSYAALFAVLGQSATGMDGTELWTARTIPAGGYSAATYGNGLFVAVGNNLCATSTDGISWAARTIPSGNYYGGIYANGLFVAVGGSSSSGACATSTDGISWTKRTIPTGEYRAVTYANGLFVAVGFISSSGACATSTDGISWTKRTIPTGEYCAVTYANGLFVAMGFSGACATSTDGISWTKRTIPTYDNYGVIYGNGLFVVVGNNLCATSTDGISWAARTIPAGNYRAVTYGSGLFVAMGFSGACATSTDGISWAARTIPAGGYSAATYGNGLFVAVGTNLCATSGLEAYDTATLFRIPLMPPAVPGLRNFIKATA